MNLSSFVAYNSVKLLPSLSRYLVPSMYGTNNSSIAPSSIALTAATPTPPAPVTAFGSPFVLAASDVGLKLAEKGEVIVPCPVGKLDEADDDERKNSWPLRSSTREVVEVRARWRIRR